MWEKLYHCEGATLGDKSPLTMTRYKQRSRIRRENRRIATEHISLLFQIARDSFDQEPDLAQNYVKTARKIGMRYKVRLPTEFRRMVCRECKSFIVPGKNCTVRFRPKREPHRVVTCLICGGHMRIPLKDKVKKGGQGFGPPRTRTANAP